jgi:photosystem II stability/assembly factor-like uncharacterized protein
LWKSTDGGATWQATPHPDGRTHAIEIAPHPSLSGHLVLATSDQNNGTALYASQDAGETWTFLTTEVGVPILYAPTFPPILYGNGAVPQNLGLVRSLDGGRTWQRVDAAPRPVRLATATDGERVVLYIGTAGGLATQAGSQTVSATNPILRELSTFGGGVYRLTTLLPDHWVHMPLVLRRHTP